MSTSIFSPEGISEYLEIIRNYRNLVFFGEMANNQKDCLLRHDIDLSLDSAIKFAKIENNLKMKATYFFLMTSPHYNLNSSVGREAVLEIIGLGHDIGLHFDASLYEKRNLNGSLQKELDILTDITSKQVRVVSLHNPHKLTDLPMFNNVINSYDKRYFEDANYMSDSCLKFSKDPYNFLKVNARIQILMHPVHYFAKESNYKSIGMNLLIEQSQLFNQTLQNNKTFIQEDFDFRNLLDYKYAN